MTWAGVVLWVFAGQVDRGPASPLFQGLSSENGLSHDIVWAIEQDRDGFLWFGTDSGLNKYDGYRFTVLKNDPNAADSLSDNQVRALCWDRQGRLWVGAAVGLNCHYPHTDRFFRFSHRPDDPHSLSYDYITALALDADGFIWAGTHRGLNRVNPETFAVERFVDLEPEWGPKLHPGVRALAADPAGGLWIGTGGGLYRYQSNPGRLRQWTREGEEGSRLTHHDVRALTRDRASNVWVGTTRGLNRLDPVTGRVERFLAGSGEPGGLGDNWISALLGGPGGEIWIGSKDGGLNVYHPQNRRFRSFTRGSDTAGRRPQISGNDIVSLFIDRSGLLWAGVYMAGLNKATLTPPPFREHVLNGAPVRARALYEDPRGDLWFGQAGGAVRWARRSERAQTLPLASPGGQDAAVIQLGDWGEGVFAVDVGGGAHLWRLGDAAFLPLAAAVGKTGERRAVHCLLATRDGALWSGSNQGLAKYDATADQWRPLDLGEGAVALERRRLTTMIQDDRGYIWVGSDGAGLLRVEPSSGATRRYYAWPEGGRGLSHNRVNQVFQDSAGRLWAAAMFGLNRYLPGEDRFEAVGRLGGFAPSAVFSLAEDFTGGLWLGSDRGLSRLVFADQGFEARHFDASDGLPPGGFLPRAALRDHKGALYFAGQNGVTRIENRRFHRRGQPPPVALTSFKAFDRSLDLGRGDFYSRGVTLKSWQRFFSFEYVALDFKDPQKNRYAYMLDGFNDDWIHTGSRRFGSFNDLPVGRYTLRIKAANSDGLWNETGLALPIRILPPVWKTLWFRLLLILSVAALVYGVHKARALLMERDHARLHALVEEKTVQLDETRQHVQDLSHQSGIFEITHGVLGQIVRQVGQLKTLALQLRELIKGDELAQFSQTSQALRDRVAAGGVFGEAESESLAETFLGMERFFRDKREAIDQLAIDLISQVGLMRDTIRVQHDYAKTSLYAQEVDLVLLLDDCLHLEHARMVSLGVVVHKNYSLRPKLLAPKTKLLNVLTQVVHNSLDALEAKVRGSRELRLQIRAGDGAAVVEIADNGVGFAADVQAQIFSYGFSTKDLHLGYGLHACANDMREMNGSIELESPGKGLGATARVTLPLDAGADRQRR